MNSKAIFQHSSRMSPARTALAGAILLLISGLAAVAQEPPRAPPRPVPPAAAEDVGFFGAIGRWFDRQTDAIRSTFSNAGDKVEDLGHEASVAARTTVDNAKNVGDAVTRIPGTRVVAGHERCKVAANGAPDCLVAAGAICKTKGFASGKSLDMTTAEICPPKVYLSGRSTGEGCHTETFVSRALCQ